MVSIISGLLYRLYGPLWSPGITPFSTRTVTGQSVDPVSVHRQLQQALPVYPIFLSRTHLHLQDRISTKGASPGCSELKKNLY